MYAIHSFFFIVICTCLSACDREIDHNDELGMEDDSNKFRTEVILLDRSLSLDDQEKEGKIDSIRNSIEEANISNSKRQAQIEESLVENSVRNTFDPDLGEGKAIIYDPNGLFTVQVAGYNNAMKANDLLRSLIGDGYPAYITKRDGRGEARVRIGYFTSFKDASNFGDLLREDRNLEFWVDRRENE